ncbi:MAG: alpha/beta fold hydrolase [Acidobacteriota bacterium]
MEFSESGGTRTSIPRPSAPQLWLGHGRTVGWRLRSALRPPTPPPGAAPWGTTLEDPVTGKVRLSGALYRARPPLASRRGLLVTVHGLGGCVASPYMVRSAVEAVNRGLDVLALNLRGADRSGEDFYHAGMVADLEAAVRSAEELSEGAPVIVAGFSLGGHLALRWSASDARELGHEDGAGEGAGGSSPKPGAAAVAGLCAPLELSTGSRAFEGPGTWLYRRYILSCLSSLYGAVTRRHSGAVGTRRVPVSLPEAREIGTLREWDRRVVAPRHGFDDEEDYYRRASAAPRLHQLRLPSLWMGSLDDPMVPARVVAPVLERMRARSPQLSVGWIQRGAHLAFTTEETVTPWPAGEGEMSAVAGDSVFDQVLRWLEAKAGIEPLESDSTRVP